MADGDDWTDDENDRLVAMYFSILERDIQRIASGEPARILNKAASYREFGSRSVKAIEWKMRNVTAIVEDLGFPWVSGLVRADNIQGGLTDAVGRYLAADRDSLPIIAAERKFLLPVEPPAAQRGNERIPDHLRDLVRRFDPAKRDEENRKLGQAGEQLVFELEKRRLSLEMPKRLGDLRWVSRDDGDGAGFDIRSFDQKGEELLIEVKTTRGKDTTPFFLSRNEKRVADERNEAYRIFRVFEYDRGPKFFTLRPPLEHAVMLETAVYQASFR